MHGKHGRENAGHILDLIKISKPGTENRILPWLLKSNLQILTMTRTFGRPDRFALCTLSILISQLNDRDMP